MIKPLYSKEEFSRRGDEIYDLRVAPQVEGTAGGRFVAIDIETGAYELGDDELTASDSLLARLPQAQVWLRRVGSRYAHRFGVLHYPEPQ